MTEHYTDHDPAVGCGLMAISAAFVILAVIVLILVWLR